ncbi:Rap1a/Tai family immunity protein [Rhizobium lentis]|uniref:Rap1a/Tai family immunity protein n=1 Tax=Rhizobium lentis TaxID=1138194 RepID=UPI001A91EFE9|nr:Rap1a/Tai family immunity protein [Rhizobium lentis]MBX5063186.1 hypothetical protein [Rhizobium lentis]MBX5075291.1 hypothetical protein [Rhizobium lentis]QSW92954.1 hypothetical protein J0663_17995 [Rhizobium lentis]
MKRGTVVIGAFLISASSAHAAFFDGNFMHRGCTINDSSVTGYVMGYVDKWWNDAYWVEKVLPDTPDHPLDADLKQKKSVMNMGIKRSFCIPKGATSGQIKDVFCKYLNDNPADRAKDSDVILGDALDAAFPCL